MAKKNPLTRSLKQKAQIHLQAGRLVEAETVLSRVCQADRVDLEAWLVRASIHRRLGQWAEAEGCIGSALKLAEAHPEVLKEQGRILQSQRRLEASLAAYCKARKIHPDDPEAWYLEANALRESERVREAVEAYKQAVRLRPDFVEALANMGTALLGLNETAEAIEALNRAVTLRPAAPQIHCSLATVLQRNGRLQDALARYVSALNLAPGFLDAVVGAAGLYETLGMLEQAEKLLGEMLPVYPESGDLLLVAAKLARRRKDYKEGVVLLEKALPRLKAIATVADAHVLLGQMYDGMGEVERAYVHLSEGNRLAGQASVERRHGGETYTQRIQRLRTYLKPELATMELGKYALDDPEAPIFLIGFPRSGTTLLEQILDSHPTLQALEEKGTVSAMVSAFEEKVARRETGLLDLTEADIEALRAVYFAEVARHLERKPGTRLVDKMPLNTVNVHILWRIFPKAKFILAIRHPCDACLSCFMQSFLINEAMSNFFTLRSGAEIYQEVMATWRAVIDLLPLDFHRIRYEDLVADFEGQTRALLDFLGAGWDEAVRSHTEHAQSRGTISTPSYHQVTQPIYQHARYRWKRYAKYFDDAMPLLAPSIDYFGYAEPLGEARSSK